MHRLGLLLLFAALLAACGVGDAPRPTLTTEPLPERLVGKTSMPVPHIYVVRQDGFKFEDVDVRVSVDPETRTARLLVLATVEGAPTDTAIRVGEVFDGTCYIFREFGGPRLTEVEETMWYVPAGEKTTICLFARRGVDNPPDSSGWDNVIYAEQAVEPALP